MENKLLSKQKKGLSTRQLVIIGMLSAVTMVLGMTPLGIIQLPPPLISATIMHVPVIIGAILEGPIVGGFIGLIFGIFSWAKSFQTPSITAFMFMNPIVSVIPRILIGVLTYYIYAALCKKWNSDKAVKRNVLISAVCGSAVNTIGVLGLGYLLFFKQLAKAMNLSEKGVGLAFLGTAATNGVAEAIISAIITVAIVMAAKRVFKNRY